MKPKLSNKIIGRRALSHVLLLFSLSLALTFKNVYTQTTSSTSTTSITAATISTTATSTTTTTTTTTTVIPPTASPTMAICGNITVNDYQKIKLDSSILLTQSPGRPDYPPGLLTFYYTNSPQSLIQTDLGQGSGRFTQDQINRGVVFYTYQNALPYGGTAKDVIVLDLSDGTNTVNSACSISVTVKFNVAPYADQSGPSYAISTSWNSPVLINETIFKFSEYHGLSMWDFNISCTTDTGSDWGIFQQYTPGGWITRPQGQIFPYVSHHNNH
jgi:hypothetical protein